MSTRNYNDEFNKMILSTAEMLDSVPTWRDHEDEAVIIMMEGVEEGLESTKMLRASKHMYVSNFLARKCMAIIFKVFTSSFKKHFQSSSK